MAEIGIDAMQVIQNLTGIGGDKAAKSLEAIEKIASAMTDGYLGKTSPETVANQLQVLTESLETRDEKSARRLKERFPEEG